jgi:DNA polymerase elongation subunit (family B)
MNPTLVEILPTSYWVESDFCGSKYIMMQHQGMEPFCYCAFYYNYAYTSNSQMHQEVVRMMERFGVKEEEIIWKMRQLSLFSHGGGDSDK